MRPLHLYALLVGVAAAGAACGGSNGPSNTAPIAAFTPSCTDLACTFTDASSDADGDALTYQWNFGEPSSGTNDTSTAQSPSHTYAAAGSFHVTLKVTDANGAASTAADSLVTVSPAGPTAGFTVTCNAADCSFTGTSTPADGTLTYAWDFGEPASGSSNTSTVQNPTHTYTVTAVTDFTVTLTVTDPQSATNTKSQTITVTPAAALQCDSGGVLADCTLDVTQKAILTVSLVSRDCQFAGNRFAITSPIQQTVFTNGCFDAISPVILDGPNADKSFDAGTQIQAQFTQGVRDPTDPPTVPPQIKLEGAFPDWTISIDDGGNPTAPGEPDFNDIVLAVHGEVVP